MIIAAQLNSSRNFIYRYGDLLTRKRYAYHFESGSRDDVLRALSAYQNEDGGFGNGLELDILCPDSSGICMEMALGYLLELGVTEGPIFDAAIGWILASATADGDVAHPADKVMAFPHGPWWESDKRRILSIAGLLGRMGKALPEIAARASTVFEANQADDFTELRVYSYPVALYLRYGDSARAHGEARQRLEAAFGGMLEKDAWHHPLFFCHNRWDSPEIADSVWRSDAKKALATLQDDGGVFIERYAGLPWWRPVWTLDMLVILKDKGLL